MAAVPLPLPRGWCSAGPGTMLHARRGLWRARGWTPGPLPAGSAPSWWPAPRSVAPFCNQESWDRDKAEAFKAPGAERLPARSAKAGGFPWEPCQLPRELLEVGPSRQRAPVPSFPTGPWARGGRGRGAGVCSTAEQREGGGRCSGFVLGAWRAPSHVEAGSGVSSGEEMPRLKIPRLARPLASAMAEKHSCAESVPGCDRPPERSPQLWLLRCGLAGGWQGCLCGCSRARGLSQPGDHSATSPRVQRGGPRGGRGSPRWLRVPEVAEGPWGGWGSPRWQRVPKAAEDSQGGWGSPRWLRVPKLSECPWGGRGSPRCLSVPEVAEGPQGGTGSPRQQRVPDVAEGPWGGWGSPRRRRVPNVAEGPYCGERGCVSSGACGGSCAAARLGRVPPPHCTPVGPGQEWGGCSTAPPPPGKGPEEAAGADRCGGAQPPPGRGRSWGGGGCWPPAGPAPGGFGAITGSGGSKRRATKTPLAMRAALWPCAPPGQLLPPPRRRWSLLQGVISGGSHLFIHASIRIYRHQVTKLETLVNGLIVGRETWRRRPRRGTPHAAPRATAPRSALLARTAFISPIQLSLSQTPSFLTFPLLILSPIPPGGSKPVAAWGLAAGWA